MHREPGCVIHSVYSMHARIKSFCQDDIVRQRGSDIQTCFKHIISISQEICFHEANKNSNLRFCVLFFKAPKKHQILTRHPLKETYFFRNSLTDLQMRIGGLMFVTHSLAESSLLSDPSPIIGYACQ